MLGNVTLGHDDVSILLYSDGTYMAHSHNFQNTLGKSVPSDRPFLSPEAAKKGVYRALGAADQVLRIYAWHKLEGYSLLAIIGLDEIAILAPIEQQISHDRKRSALSIGLILILTSIIAALLIRAARQQSQLKEHVAELDRMAHYDMLTGTPNRRLLSDRLGQAIARARRNENLLAVCCLDLDGFKAVNDEHGHAVGDKLLIALSERMKAAIREVDTLARIGGDEFVLMLIDLEKPADCQPVLERLLQAVAEPVTVDNAVMQVSASIGVTLYPYDGEETDQLLRHADQALYRAKQAGKNRYHLYNMDQAEIKA